MWGMERLRIGTADAICTKQGDCRPGGSEGIAEMDNTSARELAERRTKRGEENDRRRMIA